MMFANERNEPENPVNPTEILKNTTANVALHPM